MAPQQNPAFLDQVTGIVLGYGLIGVVAAILAIAVFKLYTRNQVLNDTLFKVGQEAIAAQASTAAALNRLSDLLVRGKQPG
jgi:hypothetical protein